MESYVKYETGIIFVITTRWYKTSTHRFPGIRFY